MNNACSVCKFWKELYTEKEPVGECRKTTPSRSETGKGVWPKTNDNDWCGEYEEGFDREDF